MISPWSLSRSFHSGPWRERRAKNSSPRPSTSRYNLCRHGTRVNAWNWYCIAAWKVRGEKRRAKRARRAEERRFGENRSGLREVWLIFSLLIERDEHSPRRVDDLRPLLSVLWKEGAREGNGSGPFCPCYLRPTLDRRFQDRSHVEGRKASNRRDWGLPWFLRTLAFFPSGLFETQTLSFGRDRLILVSWSFRPAPNGMRSAPAARKSFPLSVTVKRHLRCNLWKDVICRGGKGRGCSVKRCPRKFWRA